LYAFIICGVFNFTQTCLGISELGGMQIALILYRDKYDVKKAQF